jgi:hypothetical protein
MAAQPMARKATMRKGRVGVMDFLLRLSISSKWPIANQKRPLAARFGQAGLGAASLQARFQPHAHWRCKWLLATDLEPKKRWGRVAMTRYP